MRKWHHRWTIATWIVWAVTLVTVGLAACSDKSVDIIPLPTPRHVDDFPLTVGSQWTYQVELKLYFNKTLVRWERDTHYVAITDTVRMDSTGTLAAWWTISPPYELHPRDTISELFVTSTKTNHGSDVDTIRFFDSTDAVIPRCEYIMPSQVGSIWPRPCGQYEVLADSAIQTPAGRFDSALQVYVRCGDLNYNDWIAPTVGVVHSHHIIYGYDQSSIRTARHLTFDLVSYHIEAP